MSEIIHQTKIKLFTIPFALFFLSPLFAPYLINPNVAPFYYIPVFTLLGFITFLIRENREGFRIAAPVVVLLILSAPFLYSSNTQLFFYSLLAALALAGVLSKAQLYSAYITFLISTAIIISLSLYVWLGWNGDEALHFYGWALTTDAFQSKMNGPFANGNVLAIIMVCAWSVSSWFWMKSSDKSQWGWLLLTIFFWIFIFSSMARGAWLAQLFILVWLVIELLRRKSHLKISALLIAGFIAWGASDILVQQNQSQLGGIQQQFEKSAATGLNARITLWKSVWEVWKENPIFGVGPSQLKAHYLTGQSKVLADQPHLNGLRDTDSAHNILLHLMAEYGIAGLMLWLLISLLILRLLWIYRHKLDSLRWPALASVVVLWIQGHINISLTEPFPLILFAFMLGICAKPLLRTTRTLQIKKTWIVAVSVLVFAFLVSGAFQTTIAWSKFGQWVQMDYKDPMKGKVASELATNDDIFPYLVEFSIAEMIHLPEKQRQIAEMRPLILRALSLNERPRLYKELFYAYLVDNKLDEACKVGLFIHQQRWLNEPNSKAYADVCNGRIPQAFQL